MTHRSLSMFCLLLLALLPACDRAPEQKQEEVAPTTTGALDIVPALRKVKRTTDQRLGHAALVVPAIASDKVQIAVDEINGRLIELGCEPLATFRADTSEERFFSGRLIRLSLVDSTDKEEREKVPGAEQGYWIDSMDRVVRLIGRDDQGLLWAAVTFRRMLTQDEEGRILLFSAEIRDWPDFAVRMMGRLPKYARRHTERDLLEAIRTLNSADADRFAAEYVDDAQRVVDFLFRLKHNLTWFPMKDVPTRMDELVDAIGDKVRAGMFLECLRRIGDYARERGVEVAAVESAHIGVSPEDDGDPDISRCVRHGVHKKYFCWTLDEHNRTKGEETARFYGGAGFSLVGLHSVDGGGAADAALWKQRCKFCRERWKENRAGADGQIYATWNEAFRKFAPRTALAAIQDPYDATILLRATDADLPATRDYWDALHKVLPRDAKFSVCVRENVRPAVEAFAKLFPSRPLLLYWMADAAQDDQRWGPLFSSRVRYASTFLLEGRRDWLFGISSGCRPLAAVAAAQYMWNVQTPGSALWPGPLDVDRDGSEPAAFFGKQLETFAVELFGPNAAPDLLDVFRGCISPSYCIAPVDVARMCQVANTPERMQQQYDALLRATGGLERVWRRLEAGVDGVLAEDRIPYLNGLSDQTCRARLWASYHLAWMTASHALRRGEPEDRIATDLAKAIERVRADGDFTLSMLARIKGAPRFGKADLNRWALRRIEERDYKTTKKSLKRDLERLKMVLHGRMVELRESDGNARTVLPLLPDSSGEVECAGRGAAEATFVSWPTQGESAAALQLDGLTVWSKDGASVKFPLVDVGELRKKPSVLRFYINGGGTGYQRLIFWLYPSSDGAATTDEDAERKWVRLRDYVEVDDLEATWQLVSIPLDKLLKPGAHSIVGFGVNNAVSDDVCGPVWIDTMYVAADAEPVEREVAVARPKDRGPAREAEVHMVGVQATTAVAGEGLESRMLFSIKVTGDGSLTDVRVTVRIVGPGGGVLHTAPVFEAARLRTPWWSPSLRYNLGRYVQDVSLEVVLESREASRTATKIVTW